MKEASNNIDPIGALFILMVFLIVAAFVLIKFV